MKGINLGEFEELVLRIYQLTIPEKAALLCARAMSDQLWARMPSLVWRKNVV